MKKMAKVSFSPNEENKKQMTKSQEKSRWILCPIEDAPRRRGKPAKDTKLLA